MTRHEANRQGIHFQCGGRLQTAEKPGKSATAWIVKVRCTTCDKQVISFTSYRRGLQGEEAKVDRQREAVKIFNLGAPWEQEE